MNIKPLFTVTSGVSSSSVGNTLRITNPTAVFQTTYLSADTVATQTSFIAVNGTGFTSTDVVRVGPNGADTTELLAVSSVSGNTLTLAASTQPHSRGDEISSVA